MHRDVRFCWHDGGVLKKLWCAVLDELPMLDQVQIEEFKQEAEEEMKVKLDI